MSGPGSFRQGQLPSSGLSGNLSSNNPFRNRAASPASPDAAYASSPTTSPFDDTAGRQRPVSRNPFLDSPSQPLKPEHQSLSAEDIFDCLTLENTMPNDKVLPALPVLPAQRKPSKQPIAPRTGETPQVDSKHRPTKSQEEAMKAKKPVPGPRPEASQSPHRRPPPQRRPRRNSESSAMDFSALPITPEEMKMIEAKRLRDRQREKGVRESREPREAREGREARDNERDAKSRSKSGRPSRRMDLIDQLDATSIYGTGLFHHDGPFDALNPHRNRSSRRAPMQAFPKDSLNNSLGGAGPLNRNPDHAQFMGNGTDEAFRDFATGRKIKNGYNYPTSSSTEAAIFDPISRGDIVHGDESYGLGTSTFLEGTPAARAAIVRRQAEQQQETLNGGLQRKKSLAQRIRHINKGAREFAPSGRMTNPEGISSKPSPDPMPAASSAGSEPNPFFAEFSKGEEKMTAKTRERTMSPVSPPPSVPRRMSGSALERRATTEATSSLEDAAPAKPSGLLGRMKSLKGGRRPKNSDTGSQSAAPRMAM